MILGTTLHTMPTAPDDPIAAATAIMLARAPARWSALERDDLTALEEQALQMLVARGLVECRMGGRIVLADAGPSFHFRIQFTGSGGGRQASLEVLQALTDHGHEGKPLTITMDTVMEWRLHEHGQMALCDVQGSDPQLRAYAQRFILEGNPGSAADHGKAIAFTQEHTPIVPVTEPVPVRVINADDLAGILAKALAGALPAAAAAPAASTKPAKRAGMNPARWIGADKLALLHFLQKNPSVRSRKQIAHAASQAGAGEPKNIRRNLNALAAAGWLSESERGTCLSEKGIRECAKKLGEHR
jgi:ribosomal protein S19E (S16A)